MTGPKLRLSLLLAIVSCPSPTWVVFGGGNLSFVLCYYHHHRFFAPGVGNLAGKMASQTGAAASASRQKSKSKFEVESQSQDQEENQEEQGSSACSDSDDDDANATSSNHDTSVGAKHNTSTAIATNNNNNDASNSGGGGEKKVSCQPCREAKVKCIPSSASPSTSSSATNPQSCSRCLKLERTCFYRTHKRGRKPGKIKLQQILRRLELLDKTLQEIKELNKEVGDEDAESLIDVLRWQLSRSKFFAKGNSGGGRVKWGKGGGRGV